MQYRVLLLVLVYVAGCSAQKLEPSARETDVDVPPLAEPTAENTFQLDGPDYTCTAFAISERWAVTAGHCIIEGEAPTILGDGPRRFVSQAYTNPDGHDVALIEVERPFVSWFELSGFDAAEPGMTGYNGGFGCTGALRADRITFGTDTTFTALNCSGDSGGPVLDARGRAIGTLTHHQHGRSGQVGVSLMAPLGDWRNWAVMHLAEAPAAAQE